MTALTPREIVSELDRFIVGQEAAKRAVAIALRNRWRRQQLDETLREEVLPKNILTIGPTGCGKTEIARRWPSSPRRRSSRSRRPSSPRSATSAATSNRSSATWSRSRSTMTRERLRKEVAAKAELNAEERVLDALVGANAGRETRDKFRRLLREGALAEREIELEVADRSGGMLPTFDIPGHAGRADGHAQSRRHLRQGVRRAHQAQADVGRRQLRSC